MARMPRHSIEDSIASHTSVLPPREDGAAANTMSTSTSSLRSSVGASSLQSTPPTSLDGSSADQDASMSQEITKRRTTRTRSSLSTLTAVHGGDSPGSAKRKLSRTKADNVSKTNSESRAVSGATLVNDEEQEEEAGVQGKMSRPRLNKELEIDMHWDMADDDDDNGKDRRRSRRMTHGGATDVIANAVSSLGKRARELAHSAKDSVTPKATRSRDAETASPKKRVKYDPASISSPRAKPRGKSDSKQEEQEDDEQPVQHSKPKPNPFVKRYQIMGLYAGQARRVKPAQHKNNKSAQANASPIEPKTENSILPLPMYGTYKRLTIQDGFEHFKLPYDVLRPLAKEQVPKDWHRLSKNVFKGGAHATWDVSEHKKHENSFCVCVDKCDEDCINRVVKLECNSKICKIGPDCGNRPFAELKERYKNKNFSRLRKDEKPESNLWGVGIETFRTVDRGYGVRSMRTFEPGQVIVEYCGEIIDQDESDRRMNEDYKDKKDYYFMQFQDGLVIDAGTRGSICRFVNHSCSPNCIIDKVMVDGEPRMALFAGDNRIMTGEELTYDYNFENFSQQSVQECKCGASNCRGVLGPKPKERESKAQKMMEVFKSTSKAVTKGIKRTYDAVRGKNEAEPGTPKRKRAKRAKPDPRSLLNKAAKTISSALPAISGPTEADLQLLKESRDARAKRAAERRTSEKPKRWRRRESEGGGAANVTPKSKKAKNRRSTMSTTINVSDLTPDSLRRGPARAKASPLKNLDASPSNVVQSLKDRLLESAKGKSHHTVIPSSRVTSQTHLLSSGSARSSSDSKAMRQSRLSFGTAGGLGYNVSPKRRSAAGKPASHTKSIKIPKRGSSLKAKGGAVTVSRPGTAKSIVMGAKKVAAAAKLGAKGDKAVRKTIRAVSGAD